MINLERWGGQVGRGHDYFENGNLDRFDGQRECLPSVPGRMKLASSAEGIDDASATGYVLRRLSWVVLL